MLPSGQSSGCDASESEAIALAIGVYRVRRNYSTCLQVCFLECSVWIECVDRAVIRAVPDELLIHGQIAVRVVRVVVHLHREIVGIGH